MGMTESVLILYDRDPTLHDYLDELRTRLKALGAQRIRKGGGYYWLPKPDLKPGEDFAL
jgi:uncharacterized protein